MKKATAKGRRPKSQKTHQKPPSRLSAESMLRSIQKLLEEKQFASLEEANEFLATLGGPGLQQSLLDDSPLSAQEEAQDLAFEAMEAETEAQARMLVKRALALDPDCVDALVLLTELDATSPKAAIEGMQRAVAAGERALGAKFFAENKGHFWGILETRPYMRARLKLAGLLLAVGLEQDAITHYEGILELNPNDNQGVRDLLLGSYLAHGRLEDAQKLLKRYKGDISASFAWGKVLERYLSGDLLGAEKALKNARQGNGFVELYLTGQRELPTSMPDYYSLGSDEEAVICLDSIAAAWTNHPAAIAWLMDRLRASAPPTVRTRRLKKRIPPHS